MKAANIILLFCFVTLSAQENPYMQMAGKRYAEYSQELFIEYTSLIPTDSVQCLQIIHYVDEVAKVTGSMEWQLMSEYLELLLFERNMELFGAELYPVGELLRSALELLEKAKRTGTLPIELLARWKLIYLYFNKVNDYESAFRECAIQDMLLHTVTSEEIPDKANLYLQIAHNYFHFKDYPTAISYFKKILEEKVTVHNQIPQQGARNGIGLSYTETGQLDTAEMYFQAMKQESYLSLRNESYQAIFDALSDGNMGAIMLIRNEYDSAIPLFENSFDKALKSNDNPFAACRAVDLANIYLLKNNLSEAKRYIDLAITCRNRTKTPRNNDVYYEVVSKYYAATGDTKQSIACMNLMLEEKKQAETQFNALLLLRMEQNEAAKRQLVLTQETAKRQQAQRLIIVLALGLVIIFGLSGVLLILYRRKRKAYRELVRKSQEWATAAVEAPDSFDRMLFDQLKELMTAKRIYQDPKATLESTAKLMSINRTYLSQAINRCTEDNFNAFINEFRIKEAVRIMSDGSMKKFSIEGIAIETGFNDRKTFYRVFKKLTGLSPSEFRSNVD